MTQTINIHEVKTRPSHLLKQVEEGEEIIISRVNKPIAQLVPYQSKGKNNRLGEAKGMVEILADFDQLPSSLLLKSGMLMRQQLISKIVN